MAIKPKHPVCQEASFDSQVGEIASRDAHLDRHLSFWGIVCVSWNVINVFGGPSYVFVVGFSAGGISTIFYGL